MKRSKKYLAAKSKVESGKLYPLDEALTLVKETSLSKFPGSIEVEMLLKLGPKQKSESIRGNVSLPHNFGKEVKVLAFADPSNIKFAKSADISGGEELIEKVEKGEVEYDVVLATPAMMPKIAKLGKTLGRKGLMPNPKNQTVTTDLEKSIEKFKSGQRSFKLRQENKINFVIGKTDMSEADLKDNYEILLKTINETLKKLGTNLIGSVRMKAAMGPVIYIQN